MADDIKPLSTVQMATVLAHLQNVNAESPREGELIPAGADDNPQQPSMSEQFFQMVEVQTGYLESIAADIEMLVNQFDEFFAQQALDKLGDLESAREDTAPLKPMESKQKGGKNFLDSILEWVDNFKRNFLLGLVGLLSALTLANFGFTGLEFKFLSNIKTSLMGGIDKTFKAIEKFSKPLSDLFKGIGSKIGVIFRSLSKFLLPISIAMSAFDATTYADEAAENAGTLRYIGEWISGFLGSFFGEFANLVKSVILWPFKEFLADEEGNFDTSTMLGKFLDNIDKLDFNKLINNIFTGLYNTLEEAYAGVKQIGRFLGFDMGEVTETDQKALVRGNEREISRADNQILAAQTMIAAGQDVQNQKVILEKAQARKQELLQEKEKLSATAPEAKTQTLTPTPPSRITQTQQLSEQTQINNQNSSTGGVNIVAPNSVTNNNNSSSTTALIESPEAENRMARSYGIG